MTFIDRIHGLSDESLETGINLGLLMVRDGQENEALLQLINEKQSRLFNEQNQIDE